ncbi:TraU family protein, partial [Xanthomonas euvesicatoria]|uniref:TraU family protein n=1 Tax=Xanthomonas euvesicatoria TaxID=456327 RepID=UPI0019D19A9E
INPVWTKERLANLTHPESKLFANPVAQLACMADAVTSTVSKPSELLFWCAGSWGAIYPHMGYLGYEASAPRETSLLATRVWAQMHRRGLAKKRYGNGSVCAARFYFTLPKQGYRLQTFYPLRETKNNHWIG